MKGIEAAFFGMVGKAAELKTSRAGNPFATFSVGTDAGEDKDGKAVLEWVRVKAIGQALVKRGQPAFHIAKKIGEEVKRRA